MQRIGRGGRQGGEPAVIVLGVNMDETPKLFEKPKEYLMDTHSEIPVCSTRAMRISGALRNLCNVRQIDE